MFKKVIATASIIFAAVLCTACGSANSIKEENIEKFLKDSEGAITYMYSYEPEIADKTELDSDLKVRIAAAALAARADYFDGQGSTFCIPAKDIEAEVADLFADSDISDFTGNKYVYKDDNGDYQLLNGDWGDSWPKFKVKEITYGSGGSKPAEVTVNYTYETEDGDMFDTYNYEAKYKVEADKGGRYTLKITGFEGKNLIPVEN